MNRAEHRKRPNPEAFAEAFSIACREGANNFFPVEGQNVRPLFNYRGIRHKS